jgi:hypothetical protein
MANRQSAPAAPRASAPEDTARVVMHKSALPGWFWGMLGCLSVLGVGFGVLILVARNGLLDGGAVGPAPAGAAVPAAPAPPAVSTGSRPRPQIEQLAPPAAPPLIRVVEPKPKPQPHAIKLARSPSAGHPTAAADKPAADKPAAAEIPAADDKPAAASGEAASAKKPADKAAGDDDQVVRHRKPAASDDDDDDDDN